MRLRGAWVGLACAAGLLASAAPVEAATPEASALRFRECPRGVLFDCARLSVPLDRSGAVPGRVSLLVKRTEAYSSGRRRAPVVLLAGGPGESATATYTSEVDLFDPVDAFLGINRHRDLIVFDQRGTGGSGLLRCRRLERAALHEASEAAADCAAQLGPRRAFYTTRDSVEDIEAIRRQLRRSRIVLIGTSYGTKVALAYALRYPRRVERLVLDSVLPLSGPDPFALDSVGAVPRVLRSVCRRGCRSFTPDPVRDLEQLVAVLGQAPLQGRVFDSRGRPRPASLARGDLLSLVISSQLDLSLFPAHVRSAALGDPAPLLRLQRHMLGAPSPPPQALSSALFTATVCEEAPFPWDRTTPFPDRPARAAGAAALLPDSAFQPFDRGAVLEGLFLNLCERWPAAPLAPALGPGPLPDVPVLLLAGEHDLRTPLENARAVARLFPRARLHVARGAGHSVLSSDFLGCSEDALERFFAGRPLPRCSAFPVLPSPPAPTSLQRLRRAKGGPGLAGRTITAVRLTIDDALTDALVRLGSLAGDPRRLARTRMVTGGGLRGGSYSLHFGRSRLHLRGVVFVPGVQVSGLIHGLGGRRQRGRLRVRGQAAPDGTLVLRGSGLRGRLGGRRVRSRLSRAQAASATARALLEGIKRPKPRALRPRDPGGP